MIIRLSELKSLRKKCESRKIVLTGGTFDLLHYGHIRHLEKLRNYGDVVVVSLMSDMRARLLKGPGRPVINQVERAKIMDSLKAVDYVVRMPRPHPNKPLPTFRIIRLLSPDVFVTADKRWEENVGQFEKSGVKLVTVPREKVNSTTRIIKKIIRSHRSN